MTLSSGAPDLAASTNLDWRSILQIYLAGLAALLLASCSPGEISQDAFETLLEQFPGDYNNDAQIELAAQSGSAEDIDHRQIFVRKVDLPSFGEHVFYLEWRDMSDPDAPARQRFYAFETLGNAVKINLHIFPMEKVFVEKTAGAYLDPSKLRGITPDDMYPLPGCDIYLTWDGTVYSGAMKRKTCKIPEEMAGAPTYSWTQMRISEASFEYKDGWYHLNTDDIIYDITPTWLKFKR